MCKTPIERTKGCNHMTCAFCLYEFCWICHRSATADSGHWDEYSLNGCGADQLDGKLTHDDYERLMRKKMGKMCCCFFLFPILVIGWVPYYLCTIFLDQTDGRWPNWLRYPLAVFVFILGIPLGLIAIPFAIIYWLYKIFRDCCYVRCCIKT